MSDNKQRLSQRLDAELTNPLYQQRPLNQEDDFYDTPLCPCEATEPENQSEYDVAGDWVTYDGPINEDIFEGASYNAGLDLEAQMRAYFKEPVATLPPSSSAPVPNGDAPEASTAPKAAGEASEGTSTRNESKAELEDNEASMPAEEVDAPLDPKAAEREEQEPRYFAAVGDSAEKNMDLEDQSSCDGAATAEFADVQAPQANDGDVVQAEITSAESQAVREASGTDEVVNE